MRARKAQTDACQACLNSGELARRPLAEPRAAVDCCHSATMCNLRHVWSAVDGRRTEDARVAPLAARVAVIAAAGQVGREALFSRGS
jgi:hypothetical protein